jgi:hypothetical protein
MGVLNGQAVSQEVTNPAFINKNIDDTTTNNVGFASPASDQGTMIEKAQREWNAHLSFMGGVPNQDIDYRPDWGTPPFGNADDSLYEMVQAILANVGPLAVPGRSDSITAGIGDTFVDVVFNTAMPSDQYVAMPSFRNDTDTNPFQLQFWISAQTAAGFRINWAVPLDTANYEIQYQVRGKFNP